MYRLSLGGACGADDEDESVTAEEEEGVAVEEPRARDRFDGFDGFGGDSLSLSLDEERSA